MNEHIKAWNEAYKKRSNLERALFLDMLESCRQGALLMQARVENMQSANDSAPGLMVCAFRCIEDRS